jgi:hypothetical protein
MNAPDLPSAAEVAEMFGRDLLARELMDNSGRYRAWEAWRNRGLLRRAWDWVCKTPPPPLVTFRVRVPAQWKGGVG